MLYLLVAGEMKETGTGGGARCTWCLGDQVYIDYHDTEWGVPLHDDRMIFEFMTLESFQAGLSWLTILRKRESFRKAFASFDPAIVSQFGNEDVDRLMSNADIVRNRKKIEAAVRNAGAFLSVADEFGSFDRYIWQFVGGKPVDGRRSSGGEIPASTPVSEKLSADLKSRGFSFMGPTVCYAHMQATGMVNDHVVGCFRHSEIASGKKQKRAAGIRRLP